MRHATNALLIDKIFLQLGQQVGTDGVAQNNVHFGQIKSSIGIGLGHTAAQHDDGIRQGTTATAQKLTQFAIAFPRNGTRVDDQYVCLSVFGDEFGCLVSCLLQLAAHGLGFVLVHFTPVGVKRYYHNLFLDCIKTQYAL